MAMLGGSCSKCCTKDGLKCYVPASTRGACCKLDGTCSIEAECDCDTGNGEVFNIGRTCEACPKCPEQDQWPSYVLMDCDTVFTERVPETYSGQCLDAIEQYFSPSGLTLQLQSVSETGRTATYSLSGLSSLQSPYSEHNHYPGSPHIPYQAGFTATVKISCGENSRSPPYTEFFLSGSQYFGECDQTVGQSGLSGGVRTFVSSTYTVRSLDLITLFIQGDANFTETSSGAAPGFATGSVWQPAASWSPISPWPWQPNIQYPGSWFETPSGNVYFDASQTFVVSCNPLP